MQAMILAAGLGTRLLPHTLVRPKPLFPILNQPLLLLTIKRLQNIGFNRIVVNCHHLKDQVVRAVDGLVGVVVQEEEEILGTGGGLRTALNHLCDEPLLVTNGDIYHTVDLLELYTTHTRNQNTVTLAMHNFPRFNTVAVNEGRIRGFGGEGSHPQLAFTGLQVVEPAILEDIKPDEFSCIIDHYGSILKKGVEIACYRTDHCFWSDMGTVDDYLELHRGLLNQTIPCWQELGDVRKQFCVADTANLSDQVKLTDWACIGNAQIEKGTEIERTVVWDNVSISGGCRFTDTVVSTDFNKEK